MRPTLISESHSLGDYSHGLVFLSLRRRPGGRHRLRTPPPRPRRPSPAPPWRPLRLPPLPAVPAPVGGRGGRVLLPHPAGAVPSPDQGTQGRQRGLLPPLWAGESSSGTKTTQMRRNFSANAPQGSLRRICCKYGFCAKKDNRRWLKGPEFCSLICLPL